jgi:polyhydroxybutyrate depolymerase
VSVRISGIATFAVACAFVLVACSDESTGTTSGGTPTPGADGGGGDPPDPGPGCGSADVTTGYIGGERITVSGAERTYGLFVPETYDAMKPFPVVFVFHGDGGTGKNIRASFDLETRAAGGAIFVYPDGASQTWNIDAADSLGRDIAFIDALSAQLATKLCTDTKRSFAVGFSKGAYFANMLGCLAKTPFRGVAAHGGGGPFGVDGSGTKFDGNGQLICPQPPKAALQVIGAADSVDEAQKARDYWRRANACQSTSTAYDPSPCVAYDGCATDRPEVYCEIPGLGHAIWESGAKVTWSFFKAL